MGPCIRNASNAYSEQVGWYLQVLGRAGEMIHWYTFMGIVRRAINSHLIHLIRKKLFIRSGRLDTQLIDHLKFWQN